VALHIPVTDLEVEQRYAIKFLFLDKIITCNDSELHRYDPKS